MLKIAIPISKSKTQYYINQAYIDYINDAGFEPVIITSSEDAITNMAEYCDGLILPGGIDIDPIFYDEDNYTSYSADPEKDDFERSIFWTFVDQLKPVFGICRGAQLISREFLRYNPLFEQFLEFYQHIIRHSLASDLELARSNKSHSVHAVRSILYNNDTLEDDRIYVNSMHHQCIVANFPKQLPDHMTDVFRVLAHTRAGLQKKDKGLVIEAFEIHGWVTSKIRAVQWHPEELKDVGLLQAFFTETLNTIEIEGN